MFITIITDHNGDNAKGRQTSRCAALMGVTPSFLGIDVGLSVADELECAGNLIDMLDAILKQKGIIIANVVTLGGTGKKYAKWGDLAFYPRLKDVPEGTHAAIVGSSGIDEKRFIEIAAQDNSVARDLRNCARGNRACVRQSFLL